MIPFFALTFRGLEPVCAREIAALPGARVESVSYRRVTGEFDGALDGLLGLRSADDLFLYADTWSPLPTQRSALADLPHWVGMVDWWTLVDACASVRTLNSPLTFSVTASFVGKRNYTTREIKDTVAEAMASRYDWLYSEDDRLADINLRLFIEHESAVVGVRLGKQPLHERAYTQARPHGALKPPVAAAMSLLADLKPGMRLVDPCCGSGTILLEAAALGANVLGGDVDAAALDSARQGADAAGVILPLCRWDARALPFASGSLARMVTNLPWGKQIEVDAPLDRFTADVCREIERVIEPDGMVVLLTSQPALIRFERLRQVEAIEISLFGQTPTIIVATLTPDPSPGGRGEKNKR